MKSKTAIYSLTGLAALSIVSASLGIGIVLQMQSTGTVVKALAFISFWLMFLLLRGITLPRMLVMVSTLFLLPMQLGFYFAMAMLILVLVADFRHVRPWKLLISYPLSFSVLIAFGIIALSKTYVEGGILYFVTSIVVPLLCFLVIGNSREDKPALDLWMRLISLVAIVVALFGIYIAITNPTERIGSTWSNAMTINGFYILAFFFCLGLALGAKLNQSRLFWLLGALIVFLGMLFTYTRMAMLAIVFGLGLLVFKYRRLRIWGFIAIALIPLVIPSSMMQRGEMVSMLDISILIRLIAWYKAIFVIADNPLTGIGFSTWKDIYHNMVPLPNLYAQHAHNVYINLFLEIGIIGTLAYIVIIFKSMLLYHLKAVKPKNDMVAFCVLTGMLSLLFACLTDIFIQQYAISLLFWITLALMVKESASHRKTGILSGR
ncbi:MAG: O-antigen ligase family protein [Candidatus Cloacimonetes bacterium]|jgi:O-antigen ligase|nr:O-antigen ligase family protein [Candidatus Cloacimonadota bacterium]MDD2505860.1 O-antigen ligase family protein [Candidatus Cloacimonadota bacterium]MDD4147085.1 O-antigen ligase family protein [Candidatus Cloacimonadota bacterium]MDD4559489.1 O-antigen ligase family protein [Candidatus Cloacimonadota bacterium]